MEPPPRTVDLPEARSVPASFLVKCPEELPKINLEPDEWKGLDIQQQVRIIINQVGSQWGKEYFRCALRHNAYVEFEVGLEDGPS